VALAEPIRLSGPHVPWLACGSGQRGTFAIVAASPGGSVTDRPFTCWSEPSRSSVRSNDVEAPAPVLDAPPTNRGANGRLPGVGHGDASGPEETANCRSLAAPKLPTAPVPDHGSNAAVLVAVPHSLGVATEDRGPLVNFSSNVSNGSCGAFSK